MSDLESTRLRRDKAKLSPHSVRSVSVVVPAHNEEGSLPTLITGLSRVLNPVRDEIIVVDDGSTDGTRELVKEFESCQPPVSIVHFRRRLGKTRAIKAGLERAKGDTIVIMDGDCQYSPDDVPLLLAHLGPVDVVNGARRNRQDANHRVLVSRVYNWLTQRLFKIRVSDANSGLKVFKREVLEAMLGELRPGWHRYLLVLARAYGASIREVPIRHYSRDSGNSKFESPARLAKGLLDMFAVSARVFWLNASLDGRSIPIEKAVEADT